jgi:glycosyltransferase involved in cell wall biosynthesis
MRVLHISPTFFGDTSVIGGAERFTWYLARAVGKREDLHFLTFGPRDETGIRDGVRWTQLGWWAGSRHHLMPHLARPAFVSAIRRADVIHCHQVDVLSTNVAVVCGKLLGRPVFVTDLGGGYHAMASKAVPLMRWAAGYLLISEYSRRLWQAAPRGRRPDVMEVIYAGVDTGQFAPGGQKDPSMVLYVGRLVPHKGIEYLIDAVDAPLRLHLVGRPYDLDYLAMLKSRAVGKPVVFEHDVDDADLVARYQSAMVSVLPSVATDWKGHQTPAAELFGLAVAEAMSCGTAAIVSNTASLPEVVEDGVTGWVVPAGDAGAIRRCLKVLASDPARAISMGAAGRQRVLSRFTWDATADRCIDAYRRARRRG